MAEVVGSPSIHSSTWEALGGSGAYKVSVVIDHARIDASLSLQFTEGNLMECSHRGLGVENCDHHEDAGVICAPSGFDGKLYYKYMVLQLTNKHNKRSCLKF